MIYEDNMAESILFQNGREMDANLRRAYLAQSALP
jgi:hypothetical protein